MRGKLAAIMGALALKASAAMGAAPPPALIEVMVLGTYHFADPGLDKVNVEADDVTTPRRQRELALLADEIAKFRPTRVVVERERPGPAFNDPGYAAFTPATLDKERSETVQIGYRIARQVGLTSVQGIDEQPRDGEPDYFPMNTVETYAKAKGQEAALATSFRTMEEAGRRMQAAQATASIAKLLDGVNDPATPMGGQDLYYKLLALGDGDRQPGADLNAMWYLRNAKIFAKLMNVARPGDRVLVVYGAGHGYWLRHFASTVPGYRSADVRPYLQRAARRR